MRVVCDHLREHGLKLEPSKCDVFKTEINYLAHPVSKEGVLPSKKNLEAIAECPPPDTYTKVKSFVGLVGHYRHFIKGFANIATPLYDLASVENKDKKSEHLDLPPKACKLLIASKLLACRLLFYLPLTLANISNWKRMPQTKA